MFCQDVSSGESVSFCVPATRVPYQFLSVGQALPSSVLKQLFLPQLQMNAGLWTKWGPKSALLKTVAVSNLGLSKQTYLTGLKSDLAYFNLDLCNLTVPLLLSLLITSSTSGQP